MLWKGLRHAVLGSMAGLALMACQPIAPEQEEPAEAPLHSERGGIGVAAQELSQTPVPALDARRSLAVTETAILSQFTLQEVMNTLVAQAAVTGETGTQLFRQLWDTQNPSPGQPDLPTGAHCAAGQQLNGFPYVCRTVEGNQASPSSSVTVASYAAIGLFNRFDLAPVDGADCGEYRVVFAKKDFTGGRNFIIFEAILPNPRPDLGLEGCRPVANFWRDLSTDNNVASRASKLKSFYFTGLPGFEPVVHYTHYGFNGRSAGQVRVNMFIGGPWLLREFKLERNCPSTGCVLRFAPATVKTNPFGGLFNAASTHSLASEFQTSFFPSQVRNLATGNVNTFNYEVPDRFNTGQSDSQSFGVDDYLAQFSGNSALRARIQTELSAMGSSLTPEQVVARAQALSCGGCHQRSDNANLGGFSFPSSAGFIHNSEFTESGPEGTRFQLSSALTGTFLPHRRTVLESFLGRQVDNAAFVSQTVPTTLTAGQRFTATVVMKNIGTTHWTAADGFELQSLTSHWGTPGIQPALNDEIPEGQQKSFTSDFIAPTTPGTYIFQWRMAHRNSVFGDVSPSVSIQVQRATSCDGLVRSVCEKTLGCTYLNCCDAGSCAEMGASCPIVCPPPSDDM